MCEHNAEAAADAIGSVVLQEGITSVEREGTESELNLESGIMFMDNVKTGKYKTHGDFGLNAELKFENEIKKYSYMWTERGEYSRN